MAALLALVFVPMLVEARVAAVNEAAQRAHGGIEPEGDVYDLMRISYPGVFLAMIAEGWWRASVAVSLTSAAGFAVFIAAKLLKWSAIRSLGQAWTFRVIVRPGVPLITTGPYRWLKHPNYVAVVGELVGVALMSGAILAGFAGTMLFCVLMLKRIRVEDHALSATGRQI